ncbi:unnamed protein product, partial [Vitis vinifera]
MAPHQEALSEIALQTRESPVFLCHSQSSQLSDMTEEAGMFRVHHTIGSVLCCKCGIPMTPNAANMCVKCLRTEVDITEGLQKHATLVHCPECDRYFRPPKTWIEPQLESKELLTLCLKTLKNLNQVRLIHAEFIWTEPHSKRIKVKLRVQKEVLNGAILEQAYIVEYVQQEHMCESCSRVQANPDQWVASVQVRQHVPHRRTLFYLEQLILMHDAARCAKKIKPMNQGIDFFFANWSHGKKFRWRRGFSLWGFGELVISWEPRLSSVYIHIFNVFMVNLAE